MDRRTINGERQVRIYMDKDRKEEVIKSLSLNQFGHTFDQLVKLMVEDSYVYYDYALDTDTKKTKQIAWGHSDEDIINLLGDYINDSDYAVDATAFFNENYQEALSIAEKELIANAEEYHV